MPDTLAKTEADGARLIWLLDLTYAGEVLRLSTEAVQISSDDGDLQYQAALTGVQWADTMQGFAAEGTAPSVSLEITLPPDYSWSSRVAAGHVLAFATGALSYIRDGDAYEARIRVLSGRLESPVYEGDGEPMRCSITAAPFDDVGAIVPGGAVVTEVTMPASYTNHRGNAYPIVLGHPRRIDNTAPAVFPCLPSHPVLEGITGRNLKYWEPDYAVCVNGYYKPSRGSFRIIADAGSTAGLDAAALLELRRGAGAYILAQMPLVEMSGEEPCADALLRNIVAYACSPERRTR